jgi:2-polyprenyl-3-methyl-5-hydroxy-6-metoxy-1,4-benzoquinol methylase
VCFVVGDRNRELGQGRFEYRRCEACEAVSMAAVPDDLDRYYQAEGYGLAEQPMIPELSRREQAKLDLFAHLMPGRSMLEIGPGPGLFARVAMDAGFSMYGIEMDAQYCRQLETFGVHAMQSSSPAQAMAALPPLDAIVMWHVIEHLPDPWGVLAQCVKSLRPDGVLALSTPNPHSLQFKLLRRRWAHLDAPRHLQLIPHHTLEQRLSSFGMAHVRTLTDDPVGIELNRLAWEIAVRRHPARKPPNGVAVHTSRLMTAALQPIESRGLNASTYTSVFKRSDGS